MSKTHILPWLATGSSSNSNKDALIMNHHDNSLGFTPVVDIPLVLSPELQLRVDLMKCSADVNSFRQQDLDLSKFNYDFSVEYSVLREYETSFCDS